MGNDRFILPALVGVDPFDALMSPRLPALVRRSPRMRQVVIQLRKRLPVEASGLLGIHPFVMAKSVGCLLSAEARARHAGLETESGAAAGLLDALRASKGWLGRGAGYEFDVQTRWSYYAAGSTNLIATAFVGRGLLAAGVVHGNDEWTRLGVDCARFAVESFLRTDGRGRSFRYTADTDEFVHNANLLGCALAANAAAVLGDDDMCELALEAALVSVKGQSAEGSWPYGTGGALAWVDNFHTAYNLDGLLQVLLLTGDERIATALRRGSEFWATNFFRRDGAPYYYPGRGPFDIHSAATAVDVAGRLSSWGLVDDSLSRTVAAWTVRHLVQGGDGVSTRYRAGRWLRDARHFVRWGDAHWALARATLAMLDADEHDPVEALADGGRSCAG